MNQKSGMQHEIEEKLDFVLENLQEATDEDVARAYLKLQEEARKRHKEASGEITREVTLELKVGDLLTRRRLCDDMLSNGMEHRAGPDEPWNYGPLEIRRYEEEVAGTSPPYLTLKDFDGKSWGVIQVEEYKTEDSSEGIEALQRELDGRVQEVYDEL